MSCGHVKIKIQRNEDLRRTYSPSKGFTFSPFTARMQVREYEGAPGAPMIDVEMSPDQNMTGFVIVGSALVLTVKKEDLEALPVGDPVSEPVYFHYDIIITDITGFSSKLVSGPFIVFEGVTR